MGTVVDVHGLSCPHHICNLLRAGIKPMSLPLAGRFLTTGREVPYELFKKKFFFLIYFWLCWVLVAVPAFFLVVASRATLHCSEWTPHGSDFSCFGAQALGHMGFVNCGMWAQ